MNFHESLKLLALKAVIAPDGEAHYRSICRWYSKEFHTPLHTVEELPEDEVLQTYFESTYEDLSENERADLLKELLETPEERAQRLRAQDIEEAENFEFAQMAAQEEKQKKAKAKLSEVRVEEKRSTLMSEPALASTLPTAKLEPDVSIRFVDPDEFESLINRTTEEE